MRNVQRGFTLIELIVVIVILGILAAVAIPKFVSLQGDAADASAQAAAGAVSSASAMNFAQFIASNGARGTAVTSGTTTCQALTGLMSGGVLSQDANLSFVNSAAVITCANPAGQGGTVATCNVKHSRGTATGFPVTVVCTG